MEKSIKEILSSCKLQVIFKGQNKLCNSFRFKDPVPQTFTSSVAYNFQCGLCNESYYGECVGHLAVKVAEHIGISPLTNKREQPLILVIIFWNFTVLSHRSASPQVKRSSISSITNLVYQLPHELPNDLRLRKLGNTEKSSNSGGDIQAKLETKLFFSSPVLLNVSISVKYFVRDCNKDSIVYHHLLNCNYWLTFEDFSILSHENNKYLLKLKEGLLIMRDRPLAKNINICSTLRICLNVFLSHCLLHSVDFYNQFFTFFT